MSEFEFQRYRSRPELKALLADCDLIQIVSGSPAWALSAAHLGKPLVLQVATRAIVERRRRESVERGPRAWWRWIMTRITDRMDDRGLQSADAVLVENPWMLRYASDKAAGHGAWIRYAPPGVDCSFFSPAPERGVLNHERYILSVGRFDDLRKNPDMLLEAFALLCRLVKAPPSLKLAGAGEPGPAFWRRVAELGLQERVSFHMRPTRSELAGFYRGAVCFVLPSDEEGFGMVITEAMASGIPVVATRCGGPDGIITDGVDGYLVPVGNSAQTADRLAKLVQDSEANRKMGLAARKTAERQFADDAAGEAFLDTYRRLLSGTTGVKT